MAFEGGTHLNEGMEGGVKGVCGLMCGAWDMCGFEGARWAIRSARTINIRVPFFISDPTEPVVGVFFFDFSSPCMYSGFVDTGVSHFFCRAFQSVQQHLCIHRLGAVAGIISVFSSLSIVLIVIQSQVTSW